MHAVSQCIVQAIMEQAGQEESPWVGRLLGVAIDFITRFNCIRRIDITSSGFSTVDQSERIDNSAQNFN